MIDLVRTGDDRPQFLGCERVHIPGRLLAPPECAATPQRVLKQIFLLNGVIEHDGYRWQHDVDGGVAENARLAVTASQVPNERPNGFTVEVCRIDGHGTEEGEH